MRSSTRFPSIDGYITLLIVIFTNICWLFIFTNIIPLNRVQVLQHLCVSSIDFTNLTLSSQICLLYVINTSIFSLQYSTHIICSHIDYMHNSLCIHCITNAPHNCIHGFSISPPRTHILSIEKIMTIKFLGSKVLGILRLVGIHDELHWNLHRMKFVYQVWPPKALLVAKQLPSTIGSTSTCWWQMPSTLLD